MQSTFFLSIAGSGLKLSWRNSRLDGQETGQQFVELGLEVGKERMSRQRGPTNQFMSYRTSCQYRRRSKGIPSINSNKLSRPPQSRSPHPRGDGLASKLCPVPASLQLISA